jgi:aryl-alcohol dehydrogenase-like predicted oxidoreductase
MEIVNRFVASPSKCATGARLQKLLNRVEEISKKRGISMAQVSLAWSLTQVTAPVIGSTSIKNLEDLIST